MTDKKNIMFSIQTMQVKDGKSLRTIEPDKDGVYHDVPLLVLGAVSRNNAFYDISSMIDAITNPGCRFYKNLVEGNLEGEWGHPLVKDTADLPRLLIIDRTKVSHYFTKVYTKETDDGEYTIVYGNVVPYGPYGKYLTDSFADPKRNTAFSLRSLTTKPNVVNGVQHKKVLCLVTIDAVDGCGYEQASKRFIPEAGAEGLFAIEKDYEMPIDDMIKIDGINELMGVESVTHQQVLDMLETNKVIIRNDVIGVVCEKTKSIITPQGRKSIFHTMFK